MAKMVSVSCALFTTALLAMLRALSAKRSVARLSWKASAAAAAAAAAPTMKRGQGGCADRGDAVI
jgi:hypothetical protein